MNMIVPNNINFLFTHMHMKLGRKNELTNLRKNQRAID